jgi:hypothetical protein
MKHEGGGKGCMSGSNCDIRVGIATLYDGKAMAKLDSR